MAELCAKFTILGILILVGTVTCSPESRLEFFSQIISSAKTALDHRELREAIQQLDEAEARVVEPTWPKFNCDVSPSLVKPTSVHALRPSDVNVVIAYGDSITAGNGLGAKNLAGVALENRGESWSIGEEKSLDEDVVTLANILKKYNPDLKGWSRCSSMWEDANYAWMNLAEPGGTSQDIDDQSHFIADRIAADPLITADDWKVATIFVGGNDFCAVCRHNKYCPKGYRGLIEDGIDVLYNRTTRMLVNLVIMFDITPITEMTRNFLCNFMQDQFCACALNATYNTQLRHLQMRYYEELVDLVESGKYERDDFTVVIQPFMRDLVPPKDPETGDWDTSYLSKDCFHPARKFHRAMGLGLYNSMLTPYGQKIFDMDPGDPNPTMRCPTQEHPYIFTKNNSPTPTHSTPAPPVVTPRPDGPLTLCHEP